VNPLLQTSQVPSTIRRDFAMYLPKRLSSSLVIVSFSITSSFFGVEPVELRDVQAPDLIATAVSITVIMA
jgi:hypothetical protein